MSAWDASEIFGAVPADGGRTEHIELVGPHLRVSASVNLGRFTRLSDLVDHTHGFVALHDARLLRRNGDPTSLTLPNLMVNQDEITFIGQTEHVLERAPELERAPKQAEEATEGGAPEGGGFDGGGFDGGGFEGAVFEAAAFEGAAFADRPTLEKAPRWFVIFTPGHAISGQIYVHAEMTLANFVDASEPRFLPMTKVTARSLADRRVISHFEFLLVNRTQMSAIAEMDAEARVGDVVTETHSG